MGKVLKPLAISAAIIGVGILTGGISFAPSIAAFTAGGVAVAGVAGGLATTAIGSVLLSTAIGTALSGISQALVRSPRAGLSDISRLNLTQLAAAPRKMVLGDTAFAADLRYDEPSGTDQRFVDAIIHLASHKVTSIREMRIGDKLAWTAAGGVQGEFVGFLTVEVILEAGPSAFHTVNGGFVWGSGTRLTGCATARIRIDRQGTKRAQSPFAGGLPPQVMFVGEGMPVYDPRRDSTVPGGSGPHRVNNQATWQYRDGSTVLGSNLALMALAEKLGWRINGVVSCGRGDPVSRLDLEAFAAAANACDELVTLAGGGTQRRYHGGGLIPDDSDRGQIEQQFADCVGGWWDDSRGKIGLFVAVNDLAGGTLHLTDDDILSAVSWDPFPGIAETYNVVRGLNPEPALPTNFQPTEYPEARIASADGIDRVLSLNLAFIQDKRTPQRLAKQALQRAQYQGRFAATFGTRGWNAKKGRVIRLSFAKLGFVEKLFRVLDRTKNLDGSVNLVLREENAAIYAWAAEEIAPVVPATPITYSPLNNPLLITSGSQIGVDDGATRNVARGNWASGTVYSVGDIVNNGGAYSCVVAHTASGANEPPSANWQLLISGGPPGAPGDNVANVRIYRRGATAPAGPTGNVTFDFSTGQLTESTPGALNGWTVGIPTTDGNPAWERWAGARNAGSADTITPGEWSAATEALRDGAPGDDALTFSAQPDTVTLLADFAGTLNAGQLPRTVQLTVFEGGENVTALATYSVSTSGVSITNLGGGAFRIDSIVGETGHFDVTATVGRKQGRKRVTAQRVRSGSNATRAFDEAITVNNAGSYGASNSVELIIGVGPGTVAVSVTHGYQATANTTRLRGKFQYRDTPGSGPWIDVGSSADGSQSDAATIQPGELSFSRSHAGPSSPINRQYRYLNFDLDGGTGAASTIYGMFLVTQ